MARDRRRPRAPRNRPRSAVLALTVFVAAVALTGCGFGTQDLVLKQPTQVQNLRPAAFTHVKLPVTLSWRGAPLAAGQRYLVVVDQQPMPPGESMQYFVTDTCKRTPGCPNTAYLTSQFLFLTRANHVKVQAVPSTGPFPVDDLTYLHQATIVVLDARNVRMGEQFWATSFYVPSI